MRISTPGNTLSHYNVESMSYLLVHIYYYLVLCNIIEFDIYSSIVFYKILLNYILLTKTTIELGNKNVILSGGFHYEKNI